MTDPPLTPPSGEPSRTAGLEPFPVSPYGEHHDPRRDQPPPSKTMAGWALALSLSGGGAPVSVGLAISVLRRSRHGHDHGKGMAMAALVMAPFTIAGTVLGLLVSLGVLEVGADRDEAGNIAGEQEVSVFALRVGDCLGTEAVDDLTSGETAPVVEVDAISCSQPHRFEAYHEFDLADGPYPGRDQIAELGMTGCEDAFRGFVGVPYRRSELAYTFFSPEESGWGIRDDRSVLCLLDAGGVATGTLRNSRR